MLGRIIVRIIVYNLGVESDLDLAGNGPISSVSFIHTTKSSP
jgi:hypothetical protein